MIQYLLEVLSERSRTVYERHEVVFRRNLTFRFVLLLLSSFVVRLLQSEVLKQPTISDIDNSSFIILWQLVLVLLLT